MGAEQLSVVDQADEALGPKPPMKAGPKGVRYSHRAMMDLILQNPWISQGEMAAYFGYTEGWVSLVLNSDAFQAELAERRDELIDPAIRATIEERFKALVHKSQAVLLHKLSGNPDDVSADVALRVMDGAAKALGYGAKQQGPQVVQNFVALVPQKAHNVEEWAERYGVPEALQMEHRGPPRRLPPAEIQDVGDAKAER